MNEFELIRRFFAPRSSGPGVVRGVGDDAAVVEPSPGHQLVMTMDSLLVGRHFPGDLPAGDIGWFSLAANLSDLAAMGADPRWCLLSLSMPEADEHWLDAFCDGFYALAEQERVVLVGGDLVRGELAISIQVTGEVPEGTALARSGACSGERVCIGGVPGEAAAGLVYWQNGEHDHPLARRFIHPTPQLALGRRLRGQAGACIDISDGLLADLAHVLQASGVSGAELNLEAIPHGLLADWPDQGERLHLQLAGGDDYLLLFTLAPEAELPEGCHDIGRLDEGAGIRVLDRQGRRLDIDTEGYRHFSS